MQDIPQVSIKLFKENGFHYCPSCASQNLHFELKHLRCTMCGYTYYQNTAASTGAIIWRQRNGQKELLLVTRALDPECGQLDLPGGFVDPGESLEQSLFRELAEELGSHICPQLSPPVYLLSASNQYYYKNNIYIVCDIFFSCELLQDVELVAADDVADFVWYALGDIKFQHIAFPSTKAAIRTWLQIPHPLSCR